MSNLTVRNRRTVFDGWLPAEVAEIEREGKTKSKMMVRAKEAVHIVAYDNGQVIFVRVDRPVVGARTLELPAGGVEAGEESLTTAKRELEEETGFQAARWQHLGSFVNSGGISTERCHLYLASELTSVRELSYEEDGELTMSVESIPFAVALNSFLSPASGPCCMKTAAALLLAEPLIGAIVHSDELVPVCEPLSDTFEEEVIAAAGEQSLVRLRRLSGAGLPEAIGLRTRPVVHIATRDRQGRACLVGQYRWPIAAETIEYPAGGIDGEEGALTAAARELAEELGMVADSLRVVGPEYFSSPGVMDERASFVVATGCHDDQRLLAERERSLASVVVDEGVTLSSLPGLACVLADLLARRA